MKTILRSLILLFFAGSAFSQKVELSTMLLEGIYSGENLFVKNPFGTRGQGFCVVEVKVNGKTTEDKINEENFMIDLKKTDLKVGDKVKVELVHKKGCTPYQTPAVINPGALQKSANDSEISSFVVEGTFHQKNIFIGNLSETKEIIVNGKSAGTNINSELFEIDLTSMEMKEGGKVKIEFKYKGSHTTILLNPEALK